MTERAAVAGHWHVEVGATIHQQADDVEPALAGRDDERAPVAIDCCVHVGSGVEDLGDVLEHPVFGCLDQGAVERPGPALRRTPGRRGRSGRRHAT
jgi:hypothetical protein